ncbi:MAG: PEGA domain-containing protein [Deltaproteobacteria bacterium]|nr:PEGA domain-containing protein [Deltaproteobacteria bacterium]
MTEGPEKSVSVVFEEACGWDKDGEVVLRCGEKSGRIFFSGGRIAWARVSTIERTFTDYAAQHSSITEEEARAVYEECERSGKNVAETMVEWGLLDEPTARRLLLEHLSECFYEIFSWPGAKALFVPEQRIYRPGLTYDYAEIIQVVYLLDENGKLPPEGLVALDQGQAVEASPPEHDAPESPRRSRAGLWAFVVVLVLAAAGSGLWFYRDALFGEPPPPPPKAEPTGTVKLSSDPAGAAIFLDGVRQAGVTPTQIEDVKLGHHVLRLTVEGSPPWEKDFDLDTPDRALVFVARFTAPPATDGGPADGGTAGGGEADGAQVAAEGGEAAEPAGVCYGASGEGTALLKVHSSPSRGQIYLDGVETKKRTPYTFRKLAAGVEHLVLIEKRGRLPASAKLKLAAGEKKTLKLRLARKGKRPKGRVSVRIETEPAGAKVTVDRRRVKGTTPLDVKLKASQASTVEISKPGRRKWRAKVRPVPGEQLTLKVKLRKR